MHFNLLLKSSAYGSNIFGRFTISKLSNIYLYVSESIINSVHVRIHFAKVIHLRCVRTLLFTVIKKLIY